jgi:hypothetical protein
VVKNLRDRTGRAAFIICEPSSNPSGVVPPSMSIGLGFPRLGQRHKSSSASRLTAARVLALPMLAPRRVARPSKPALGSDEALDRARPHEKIGLTVGRIVLNNLLRRNENPLLVEPRVPSIFWILGISGFHFVFDDVGDAAAIQRLVATRWAPRCTVRRRRPSIAARFSVEFVARSSPPASRCYRQARSSSGHILAPAPIGTMRVVLSVASVSAIANASVAAASAGGRSCGDCATDPRIDQFPFDTLLLFI